MSFVDDALGRGASAWPSGKVDDGIIDKWRWLPASYGGARRATNSSDTAARAIIGGQRRRIIELGPRQDDWQNTGLPQRGHRSRMGSRAVVASVVANAEWLNNDRFGSKPSKSVRLPYPENDLQPTSARNICASKASDPVTDHLYRCIVRKGE